METFQYLLRHINWQNHLKSYSADSFFIKFMEIFTDLYDTAFPKRTVLIKAKNLINPWITKGLQKSSNKNQKLYEKMLKHRTVENENNHKTYKSLFEKLKVHSRRKCFVSSDSTFKSKVTLKIP